MKNSSTRQIPVLIDGRFLLEPRPTGTQRSALGFAKALLAHRDELSISIMTDTSRVSEDARQQLNGAEWLHVSLGNKVRAHLWEQLGLPGERRNAVHLFPLNTGPFLRLSQRQIIFIHDIHYLTAPSVYSRPYRLWNRFASALAAQRSKNIICFSQAVKTDMEERLKIDSGRITVVPQGPGINVFDEAAEPPDMPERFFLCVGGLQPHKNLKKTIEAFHKSGLHEKGCKLIIIGRKQQNFASLDLPESLTSAPWLEFTGYLQDVELIAFYRRAIGLVYVSFMEGFGLPLVEAFHLGCPVITSTLSCLPEVAGDAALLVDPKSEDAITAAMLQLANDSAMRNRLIENGNARAKLYTWQRAGEAVLKVIQQVA